MVTIGIGKFIVESYEEWNYPHFHTVVFQEEEGEKGFHSFCLELGIDGYSDSSGKDAFSDVVNRSLDFLDRLKLKSKDSKELFDHLLFVAKSNANDLFWKEYRILETLQAQKGADIGALAIEKIKKELASLRNELGKKGKNVELEYVSKDNAA